MAKKTFYCIGLALLVVFLMLASIFSVVHTESFYEKEYVANSSEKDTGMSVDDLMDTTVLLLDYMSDRRDDLDLEVTKNGVRRQAFNDREKTHMVDVKALYLNARKVMWACLAGGILLLGGLYMTDRKRFPRDLRGSLAPVTIGFILVGAALGAMFAVNFDWFWVHLHHILFSNDFWLLDPRTSTMINMFPEEFFLHMCSKMLMRFVIAFAALFAVIFIVDRKARPGYCRDRIK